MSTKIEWTDETWNILTGCTRVSPGCENCYAERLAATRLKNHPRYQGISLMTDAGPRWTNDVRMHPELLEVPLRWRKPRMIFVSAQSDLFHEDVPDWYIRFVFSVMATASDHTFQVLTKRPERMCDFVTGLDWRVGWFIHNRSLLHTFCFTDDEVEGGVRVKERRPGWVPPNVWLGTSVEDQQRADERIPHLLRCPAAVRFLSCEPLLGPVDLGYRGAGALLLDGAGDKMPPQEWAQNQVDWCIVGGESGPGARPMKIEWARSIVGQCRTAKVPVFVKQLGSLPLWGGGLGDELSVTGKGGDPSEWPEDLRVREFPHPTKAA